MMSRRILLSVFGVSFAILAVASAIAYRAFYDISHLLIVHFDAFRGIDFLGTRSDVFGIAATSWAIWLVNAFLARAFLMRFPFLSGMIAWTTLVCSFFVALMLGLIVTNN